MAWYDAPIRPLDPVIPDDQATQSERYFRDNFTGTGQNSFPRPPAQDQGQWQRLLNVQPITRGTIEKRWGYTAFTTGLVAGTNRLTNYQSDATGIRNIITSGPSDVSAWYENGTPYFTGIFNPAISNGPVRSLTSRSYQYFFDGNTVDALKWDGSQSNAAPHLSNIGILSTNVTTSGAGSTNTSYGPNAPGTASTAAFRPWTNPNNIKVNDGNVATSFQLGNGVTQTGVLSGTNFAMSTTGTAVVGIQVSIKASGGNPAAGLPAFASIRLTKDGVNAYGFARGTANFSGGLAFYTVGSSTDLWGGSWSIADVNSPNFGVQIIGYCPGATGPIVTNVLVDFVEVTVFTNAQSGSTLNSGGGVGIASSAAGLVNLTVGRTYYLVPLNSSTGHYGDLTVASASTGPATNLEFNLLVAVFNDPQVDRKAIVATADGNDPSILYQVAEIPNSQTTYTDNTPEITLDLNQPLLFTDQFGNEFGVTLNDPPPQTSLMIKHQGRLWAAGVGPSNGQNIFFTKSVTELTLPNGFIAGKYEESWPGDNYFDVSEGAETISGLLSDGTTLYIGTQSHIRRLTGSDPTNFQEPQIVHAQVGLLNQEVWQIIYVEGVPAGAVWLTPDFRVIQSDFNSYLDIGNPVQDLLNLINPSARQLANAMFFGDGQYDLLVLSVPIFSTSYCDTVLVFDLRARQWSYWIPINGNLNSFFNINAAGVPQWLFLDGVNNGANVYQQSAASTTDNGIAFKAQAITSWMHLGEPTKVKLLDDLEIAGDPTMTVTVYGASDEQDWNNPTALVVNKPLTLGPFGQYKVYLATSTAKYRYYQLVFISGTATGEWLNSYNLRLIPFHAN